jgi:hypothetical protein
VLAFPGLSEMLGMLGEPLVTLGLGLLTLLAPLLGQLLDLCLARPPISQLLGELIPASVAIELILTLIGRDRLLDDPLSLPS